MTNKTTSNKPQRDVANLISVSVFVEYFDLVLYAHLAKRLRHKLTRVQKNAAYLLSVGTFLEYFDFMIYVHMAVILNELFFPKSDKHVSSIITAVSFCSMYLFRPIGAIFIGYIGDKIGRRITVVITTMMMAISCIIMANLPTYAQIGIAATWIITICRIVQSISSMGEMVGAQLYI